ncbi:MAG: hypothetical protein ABR991_05085 [Terracidiphilus sp.]|jgi:hypothetical protein
MWKGFKHPNWLTRLTEYFREIRRGSYRAVIVCDQTGATVTYSYEDGSVDKDEVKWRDVNWAAAYKKDCWSVDQIRIEVFADKGGIIVTENMEGWEAMIDALPSHLPGSMKRTDWWEKVVQPPFATNWTTLYTRK